MEQLFRQHLGTTFGLPIFFNVSQGFFLSSVIFLNHSQLQAAWASLIAQSVKNLPAMQKTWVQFLGREDPLEKEMAIHSSILAWKIPWTEEPGRLQSMGLQESGTT